SQHPSAQLVSSNNLETTNINAVMFEDPANDNYKLKAGSPAIDAGIDVSGFGISFDYELKPRPANSKFDQGAYEFPSDQVIANAGTDRSITLPTNTVTLNGSGSSPLGPIISYLWTKKTGGAATLVNPTSPT